MFFYQKKMPLHVALTIILLWWQVGLAQVQQVLDYPKSKMQVGLFKMFDQWGRDTALANRQQDSIISMAKEKGDDELIYYTRVFVLNATVAAGKNTAVIKKLFQKQESYYTQCPYEVVTGTYYFLLGNVYFRELNFDTAFQHLFRARNIFEKKGYENIPEAVFYLNAFFGYYYYFEDYKTAAQYAVLADKYANKDVANPIFNLNNLGLAYLKMKDFAAAQTSFARCIELAKAENDPVWTGIISGNYGNTLRQQEKYQESLPYLYTDIAINQKSEPGNTAISCIYLANSLLHLDSVAKAQQYMELAGQLTSKSAFTSYSPNYYETKAYYYKKINDYKTAALYLDSLTVLKDSLKTVFSNKLLMASEITTNAEKYLDEKRAIELESSRAKTVRNFIILFLLFSSAFVIYALSQRRKKEKLIEAQKQRLADEQLAKANQQLNQYIENIREKNNLIEKISAELTSNNDATITPQMATHLQSLQQTVILTEDDWLAFKKIFEQVWPGFFIQLQNQYGDLTPAEQRLIALNKLAISSKEMANMLGISVDSLRKSRYRLRKKYPEMGLSGD